MTEEEMNVYRRVFEKDKKCRQEHEENLKREAIKRKEEGRSLAGDYVYLQEEKKDKIAHKDKNIAHPDTMCKTPATILLILGMVGSLIFKHWYLIWGILFWWYFSKKRV